MRCPPKLRMKLMQGCAISQELGSLALCLLTELLLRLLRLLQLRNLCLLLASFLLLSQGLGLRLLRLHLMNRLDEHTLVLVRVTLGVAIEKMVDVLVDLLGLAVLAEQAAKH